MRNAVGEHEKCETNALPLDTKWHESRANCSFALESSLLVAFGDRRPWFRSNGEMSVNAGFDAFSCLLNANVDIRCILTVRKLIISYGMEIKRFR